MLHLASQSPRRRQLLEQIGRDFGVLEVEVPEVRAAAHESWALGPLTLPHMLVRLVLAEQLYRACSMLANHPYHRGG